MATATRFSWLAGRRILIVRHGNTGKSSVDEERQITEMGKKQAAAFCVQYGPLLKSVKFAFCSPVARTTSTARLILGREATPVHELYFGHIVTEAHRAVDRELGYAPVQSYLEKAAALYAGPAESMAKALDAAASQLVQGPGDVLVVGHAMYMSLLTLEILKAVQASPATPAGTQVVLQTNVGEVEGFEIQPDGTVTYLQNGVHVPAQRGAPQCNDDFVVTES